MAQKVLVKDTLDSEPMGKNLFNPDLQATLWIQSLRLGLLFIFQRFSHEFG